MLARAHVLPFTRERDGALDVSFLAEDEDGRVVAYLDRLCRLARRLEGRPRRTVAEALRRQERRVRDARRLAGVAKALLDACEFQPPAGAARALEVRSALFRARGVLWPPTPGDARAPYEAAAAELCITPDEVDRLLYADAPAARILTRAPALDGTGLLARYNLELARAVLLDATTMTLTARGGWRAIFRAVKLARLMYRIERAGARRYRVELTGPAAPFIARPQRYGARFARVVPALTRAPGWRLDATLARDDQRLTYALDGSAPIARPRRRGRPPRYDSRWERDLARDFAEKLGQERGGWTLAREATPVPAGDELRRVLRDSSFCLLVRRPTGRRRSWPSAHPRPPIGRRPTGNRRGVVRHRSYARPALSASRMPFARDWLQRPVPNPSYRPTNAPLSARSRTSPAAAWAPGGPGRRPPPGPATCRQ